MDRALRVLFHRFQTVFDRIRLTFSVATGTIQVKKDKGFKFLWTNGGKILRRKDQHEGSKVIQITNAKALRKIDEEMSYAQVMLPTES